MVTIVQKENSILHQKAKEVPFDLIQTEKIQQTIKDMRSALASQEDGVAIAAPQIGVSLRIFVVSGRVQAFEKKEDVQESPYPDVVYINPTIMKLSKNTEVMDEGCLSVRWLYGKVKRSKKATVEARDEHGTLFRRGASGLLAQIFQHEIDHLDGILFIDKAKDVEEILPEHHDEK